MMNDPDEFAGVGGSYVVDPKSGKRIPAKDYKPDEAAPAQESASNKPGAARRTPPAAAASGD